MSTRVKTHWSCNNTVGDVLFGLTHLVLASRTDYRAKCYIAEKYQFHTFNSGCFKLYIHIKAINGNNIVGCSLHPYFNAYFVSI